MSDEVDINDEEREALKMEWRGVSSEGVKPADKKLLDTLAATFMLTNFGRPSVLFESSPPILPANKYVDKLDSNRPNHMYLANIAKDLLDKNFPLLQIKQLFSLIQDLDVTLRKGDSPYKGEFEGFQKWNHPDFNDVRVSTRSYFKRLIKNPSEKSRIYRGVASASEQTITNAVDITKRVAGIRDQSKK